VPGTQIPDPQKPLQKRKPLAKRPDPVTPAIGSFGTPSVQRTPTTHPPSPDSLWTSNHPSSANVSANGSAVHTPYSLWNSNHPSSANVSANGSGNASANGSAVHTPFGGLQVDNSHQGGLQQNLLQMDDSSVSSLGSPSQVASQVATVQTTVSKTASKETGEG
jgi:hypothetical protein